jgi:bacillithiol system protein YtxJ
MQPPFIPIPDANTLTQVFTATEQGPVVLFKHDPYCGMSLAAFRALAGIAGPVYVVDVARQRELSASIAECTGVQHASPQVLVLRGGGAVWTASHRAITAAAVAQALQEPTAAR